MNKRLRKILRENEDKIHTFRTPLGLRFVRVANANPDNPPPRSIGEFSECEILGYTTANGLLSRILYVLAGDGPDGLPDGCGEWSEEGYKGEICDPERFRLKCGLQPPSIERSTDETIAEERRHRAPAIKYWADVTAQRERKAEVQARADAARIAAAPKPKPTLWQRMWGGK